MVAEGDGFLSPKTASDEVCDLNAVLTLFTHSSGIFVCVGGQTVPALTSVIFGRMLLLFKYRAAPF